MKKRLGAVSAAARECLHKVAMKYTCAICFEEFKTLRVRRMKTHIENDWEPLLQQLDPTDGPLTSIMKGNLTVYPEWTEDKLEPRLWELDAMMDPERDYNPYDDPATVSAVRAMRIGGTSND